MAGMFYKPDLVEGDRSPEIDGDEARHAVSVRRMKVGEEISVTNGQGLVCAGKVVEITARPTRLRLAIDACEIRPRKARIHLAAALPKGDRQRTMIDMAVQAGMDFFTPLQCERSVSKEGKNAVERWQRIALEAMKQSRRAWLPEVRPSINLKEFLDSFPEQVLLLLASADGQGRDQLAPPATDVDIVLLVGPEGGFTETELAQIKAAGAQELKLSESVLRTETAAVLATAFAGQNLTQ